ncbi:MAG: hypothetical protein Q7S65_04300, partial [Nanoarchaeota archaeon]|nr:hypothetical protein [Nanoarchaeota archaeon]
ALARETPRVYLADGTPQPLPGRGQEAFFATSVTKRGPASVVYYHDNGSWYEIRSAQSREEVRDERWVLRQVNSATAMIYFVNYGSKEETSPSFRSAAIPRSTGEPPARFKPETLEKLLIPSRIEPSP